jgi:hypothetical protein
LKLLESASTALEEQARETIDELLAAAGRVL